MQSVEIFWSLREYFSTDGFCLFPVPAFYRLRRLIKRRHAVRLLSPLFIDLSLSGIPAKQLHWSSSGVRYGTHDAYVGTQAKAAEAMGSLVSP
jgi:hypothetical protein